MTALWSGLWQCSTSQGVTGSGPLVSPGCPVLSCPCQIPRFSRTTTALMPGESSHSITAAAQTSGDSNCPCYLRAQPWATCPLVACPLSHLTVLTTEPCATIRWEGNESEKRFASHFSRAASRFGVQSCFSLSYREQLVNLKLRLGKLCSSFTVF